MGSVAGQSGPSATLGAALATRGVPKAPPATLPLASESWRSHSTEGGTHGSSVPLDARCAKEVGVLGCRGPLGDSCIPASSAACQESAARPGEASPPVAAARTPATWPGFWTESSGRLAVPCRESPGLASSVRLVAPPHVLACELPCEFIAEASGMDPGGLSFMSSSCPTARRAEPSREATPVVRTLVPKECARGINASDAGVLTTPVPGGDEATSKLAGKPNCSMLSSLAET